MKFIFLFAVVLMISTNKVSFSATKSANVYTNKLNIFYFKVLADGGLLGNILAGNIAILSGNNNGRDGVVYSEIGRDQIYSDNIYNRRGN